MHRIASTNQHPILFLFFGARIYQEAHARCDTAHGAWQWKTRGGETLETGWHLVVAALCVKSMLEILFVIKRWTLDQVHMIFWYIWKVQFGRGSRRCCLDKERRIFPRPSCRTVLSQQMKHRHSTDTAQHRHSTDTAQPQHRHQVAVQCCRSR